MIDSLREILDDIDNEWEHGFVESLLIEEDEGRDFSVRKLTDKQFKILIPLYYKWYKYEILINDQ